MPVEQVSAWGKRVRTGNQEGTLPVEKTFKRGGPKGGLKCGWPGKSEQF